MTTGRPLLVVLTGPTASGKTALALRWAAEAARGVPSSGGGGLEIVSCDSLCVYRGMDVGTAKPTREERAAVAHHLIDVRDVDEPLDVAAYVEEARVAVAGIVARGRVPLVVGGSGFYLRAFHAPVADATAVPAEVRARVAALEAAGGAGAVRAALEEAEGGVLPAWLDVRNPRRLARALERRLAAGRPLEELRAEFARAPSPFSEYDVRTFRVARPRGELAERIAARTRAMVAGGALLEEARRLRAAGIARNPAAAAAIGYREALAVLDGRLPARDLEEAIVVRTRQLVRRQETWFRHQLPAHRVLAGDEGWSIIGGPCRTVAD